MTNIEMDMFRLALEGIERPDELDRIQHAGERDYAMACLERDANRLQEVSGALGRINAGSFGVCVTCEKTINALLLRGGLKENFGTPAAVPPLQESVCSPLEVRTDALQTQRSAIDRKKS
jgi:hypothetical protein